MGGFKKRLSQLPETEARSSQGTAQDKDIKMSSPTIPPADSNDNIPDILNDDEALDFIGEPIDLFDEQGGLLPREDQDLELPDLINRYELLDQLNDVHYLISTLLRIIQGGILGCSERQYELNAMRHERRANGNHYTLDATYKAVYQFPKMTTGLKNTLFRSNQGASRKLFVSPASHIEELIIGITDASSLAKNICLELEEVA
ncbi:hypothetical protein BKA61DRAFT_571573 [Leptodontidium sp. MPI-SDFR-AT-0119]|nr:hypothetical protein BKA61DRAFT_571573 [Leptodontidium sp. MPI-SDFR-AT-0119]